MNGHYYRLMKLQGFRGWAVARVSLAAVDKGL